MFLLHCRLHRVLIALAAVACAGCSSNPWTYNAPPTTVALSPASMRAAQAKPVIVVGEFADPSRAPQYSAGVGRCLSEALSRSLMNDGSFDVWINPQLSRDVERILVMPAAHHDAALGEVSATYARADYVISGKVTDFYHTTDLPSGAARKGLFGPRHEAVVAIDLRIVDLRTRRIVGADHIKATASARGTESGELYQGVALDSYVFWSTPLGCASKDVIERSVARAAGVVPTRLIDPQISHMIARRTVRIIGGTEAGLVVGHQYYVLRRPERGPLYEAIRDAHTGAPLRIRVEAATAESAIGWLLGERPLETDLRGSILALRFPAPDERVAPDPVDATVAASAEGP